MAGQLVAIQAFDSNGVPAAGAKFYTYAAGTTTPKAAYSDEAGSVALSNPVVANAAGIAACYLKSGIGDYKIALKDSTGAVFLFRTIDNYTPDTDSILYIIGSDIETARTEALDAAEAAELAQSLAETAQAAAEAAQLAAENAETGAQSAQAAAEAAQAAAEAAEAGVAADAAAALAAQAAAELAETHAETAETNAETAETNAEAAQALAEAAAAATEGSAATAAASASDASDSATAADASADSALAYAALAAESAGVAAGSIFGTVVIVKSRTTTAQPGAPANLDTYIIPSGATGAAWSTFDEHDIARYYTDGASWVRIAPMEGALAYSQDTNLVARFDTTWADILADQSTAETGSDNIKLMTPLRVAQAIDAQAPQETIASQAEAETGSENTKMMTALRTAQAIVANVLDEDAFTTDSATKAPSQQSVGAYIKSRGTIPQSIPASGVAGTADAITLTVTGGPSLADGLAFVFQPEAANTGGVTINYNSGGAVQLLDADGVALAADALKTTAPVLVRYDNAAAKWRLLAGGSTASAVSWVSVADYGAVGGNASADTGGFEDAIATGARAIYVPRAASAYLINAQLTLGEGQHLFSFEGALIQKAFNGDLFNMDAIRCGMTGLDIDGDGGTYTGRGIVIASGTDQYLDRCRLFDVNGYCLEFTGNDDGQRFRASKCLFQRTTVNNTTFPVKLPTWASTTENGNRNFDECYGEGGPGPDLAGSTNTAIRGCSFTVIKMDTEASRYIITGNRFATLGDTITLDGYDGVFSDNVVAGNIAIASGARRLRVGPNADLDGVEVTDASTGTGDDVNWIYDTAIQFTPTWGADTTNPTIGNGSLNGWLFKNGRMVLVQITVSMGSTTTFGTADWWFQLPSPYSNWTPEGTAFGNCRAFDSGTGFYGGVCRFSSADAKIRPYNGAFAANGIRSNTPMTWASGDSLELSVVFFIG